MTHHRTRAAAVAALAFGLSLGATAAGAAPKPVAPKPVAPQVQLRVNPVASTPYLGDLTATVTVTAPRGVTVTGTYEVLDGGVVVGAGTLASGTGKVALDLAPGTHTLKAVYSGTAKVSGASTKVVVVAVPAS